MYVITVHQLLNEANEREPYSFPIPTVSDFDMQFKSPQP